ncbi:carbamoyltransferase HypF [Sideroxyarcus emersonii]|uniref:Carbamoyltransferase HypF n=1 Tax=Sideroxyarcus emersonii TaxID=2764705 RepID=A0AAN2C007_9PROT|nr:carbamoyltransferase HypF [Sideroxyarcus emersonii]BCK88357.1 carbamoyltransferase HypF [Sideroxyarcus emersonii]
MIHAQIRVSGQVQGVGFRPFVYRLAHELGLAGWVRNDSEGVEIAVEGDRPQVMRLIERLQSEPPVLARVEKVTHDLAQATTGLQGFTIAESRNGKVLTGIAPDIAICADCLAELFDPADRRYRHAFINCIQCGPRYTLTARLPYDRANTSMAKFRQCPACQQEYDTPTSRRFHAQPNACPECGPRLSMFDAHWNLLAGNDPVAIAAARIGAGEVVAVKGIGGFHLVCDARNVAAVARLRGGKQREEKPFAVMVLNAASARPYAQFREQDAALLQTGERPIVLLRQSAGGERELPGIAPGLSRIGLMLPYAPLHYLLFHELLGRPAGRDWLQQGAPLALVMTSANPGGEPLVKDDSEARLSLSGLADAFLTHDRDILHRCDDSVMKWQGIAPAFVRRARGYTPRRIVLPFEGPPVLACGAWLKNTVCLTRGNEAFVSQHIGDLDHAGARLMLEETVAYLGDILGVRPEAVAHDLHPDFYSTQFAQAYAAQHKLPMMAVQHHHAHIAAVCAEHRITGPVLGLALDGVGLGSDGSAWGGELLHVDGTHFQRFGHLAPLTLPGGDRAAREPWRMAAAVLFDMQRAGEIVRRFPGQGGAEMVVGMLQRRLNCVTSSSMGRYFDAAAGLLGVSEVQGYEGQAAMLLESLAERHGKVAPLALGYIHTAQSDLDFRPLLIALADCKDAAYGAALFHATLAEGLCTWVLRAAGRSGIDRVALGGGCFLNGILTQALSDSLSAQGLHVLTAQQLPPNDGAISFGQASIALQRINQGA